ncbi:MAG: DUF4392 domain-containing protein, partial [Alphaproteobacteria bacterium]|nr:DUF4392 domain-containing protein [Alphaproteobacteria bacterium]
MPIDAIIGDSIDRAVSIEMRFGSGLPRGVIHPLYEAARNFHGEPLCFLAARKLKERVAAGRNVIIATGAGSSPGLPKGETDGPMGAAAIARAIELALAAKPIVVTEERNIDPVVASVEAAGLMVCDDALFVQRNGVALVQPYPLGLAGKAHANTLFDRYNPAAVIFIEKGGPNRKGVFHSIMGTGRQPDIMANCHYMVEQAASRGVLSIGVGDGGNEIGCGNILDAVTRIQPYGKKCLCSCQGGIGTVVKTDILVFASVSNWGGYGIVAALAGLTDRLDVLHDTATELRMLEACVAAGGMDGAYARMIPYVDGTCAAVQTSLIVMLNEIVS